jgi:hypothetical protein
MLGHGAEEIMYFKYLEVISFKNVTIILILVLGTQIMRMSGTLNCLDIFSNEVLKL